MPTPLGPAGMMRVMGRSIGSVLMLLAGCAKPEPSRTDFLRLDMDRDDPKPFIAYYFGGLVSAESSDPFDAGLVVEESEEYFLDLNVLASFVSSEQRPADQDGDGTLDWDELEQFLQAVYYEERDIPAQLDDLWASHADSSLFELAVDGVMTSARREIRVPMPALRSALFSYAESGNHLIYPTGTVVVGGHVMDGRTVEYTAMRKRADGFWDFAVYDSTGFRAPATATPPRALTVPTQCAGCHLGSRTYEPERSFPAPARPGPDGPRAIHWESPMPTPDLVRHFDEHRKRSDGILGVYGTLYTALLLAERERGTLSAENRQLLESLGL